MIKLLALCGSVLATPHFDVLGRGVSIFSADDFLFPASVRLVPIFEDFNVSTCADVVINGTQQQTYAFLRDSTELSDYFLGLTGISFSSQAINGLLQRYSRGNNPAAVTRVTGVAADATLSHECLLSAPLSEELLSSVAGLPTNTSVFEDTDWSLWRAIVDRHSSHLVVSVSTGAMAQLITSCESAAEVRSVQCQNMVEIGIDAESLGCAPPPYQSTCDGSHSINLQVVFGNETVRQMIESREFANASEAQIAMEAFLQSGVRTDLAGSVQIKELVAISEVFALRGMDNVSNVLDMLVRPDGYLQCTYTKNSWIQRSDSSWMCTIPTPTPAPTRRGLTMAESVGIAAGLLVLVIFFAALGQCFYKHRVGRQAERDPLVRDYGTH